MPAVDRPPPESGVLSVGRPRDRLAEWVGLCTRPVHIGGPGDRPLARHDRPLARHNGQKIDRWPVDRKGKIALSCCQRADLFVGYKYPLLWAVLAKIFKSKNPYSSSAFQQEFLGLKVLSLFILKCWKNQRKIEYLRISF